MERPYRMKIGDKVQVRKDHMFHAEEIGYIEAFGAGTSMGVVVLRTEPTPIYAVTSFIAVPITAIIPIGE